MTVQTTSTTVQFQGDSTSVSFPFPFRVLETDHVDVFLVNNNTASSVQGIPAGQVQKLDPSKYSVAVNQNSPGGTVTFTGSPAPTDSITVTIERNTPETQLTNYVPNDPFPAESHERALDKLTLIVQELRDEAGNGGFISAPPGENPNCPPLPPAETRAGKFIQFNSNGCPVLTDLTDLIDEDGDLNITAPQTLDDLTNVSAASPNERDVISFNPTTGQWTPENNVFSINDVSGDVTLGTNENGDIVVNPGEDNETTVVEGGDIGAGSALVKSFTAAEGGAKGDPVAIRSNAEVELIKRSQTTGGEIDEFTLVTNESDAAETVYIPDQKTHASVFIDAGESAVKVVLFTLDAENQVIDAVGSEQTISSTLNTSLEEISMVYDSVNGRLVVVARDDDAGDIVAYVAEPDFENLALAAVGSKQSSGVQSGGNVVGSGYDSVQGVVLIGFQDGGAEGPAWVAASVDPGANSVSFGSKETPGGTVGSVTKRFPFSPENNTFAVTYIINDNTSVVRVAGLSLSGTTITLGSPTVLADPGAIGDITWDSVNGYFVAIFGSDNGTEGAVISSVGVNLTVENQSVLSDENVFKGFMDFDPETATWVSVGSDSNLGDAGFSGIGVLSGTVDPDVPKVIVLPGGAGPSGLLTRISSVGDADTGTPAPGVYDTDFRGVVAVYQGNTTDHDFALRASVGGVPALSTNRNRWIGVATEEFSAGEDVQVALRGSEAFVNTDTAFQPGERLFLDDQGFVQKDGTFTLGIATKADERVLTAGVAGGTEGGASASTASSVDEVLTEAQDVTSPVSEITVDLDPTYRRFTIEIMELQFTAGSGSMAVQFSPDGGNTYIDTDYRFNQQTTPFDISEPRVDAASGKANIRWRATAPGSGEPETAYLKIHVWGAGNSEKETQLYAEGIPGDVTFEWLAGRLEQTGTMNKLRFFNTNGSENIAFARVRVRGIE